ncbi:hypothetical protein B0H16DRAFT_538413 [Mycena metata]|uniref:Uncharacterized protein n=1 Tax=Mycena metata TaxID=1033252 RepID=A0AAD7JC55_9AGAR|nr:hypothetical protein B0H16DRAFT_538413 [Mycena metata]
MYCCFLLVSLFLSSKQLELSPTPLKFNPANRRRSSYWQFFVSVCGLPINRMDGGNASAEEDLGWEYSEVISYCNDPRKIGKC